MLKSCKKILRYSFSKRLFEELNYTSDLEILNEKKFFIEPEDKLYEKLKKSGIYRVFNTEKDLYYQFLIPYKNEIKNIKAMNICFNNGNIDNKFSNRELIRKIQKNTLFLSSSKLCNFYKYFIDRFMKNIKSRLIYFLNTNWEKYNTGHTMLEIFSYEDKKYIILDLARGICFLDNENKPLNGFELIFNKNLKINYIKKSKVLNYDNINKKAYFYLSYLLSENGMQNNNKELFNNIFIFENNKYYCLDNGMVKNKIVEKIIKENTLYKVNFVSKDKFNNRFYLNEYNIEDKNV